MQLLSKFTRFIIAAHAALFLGTTGGIAGDRAMLEIIGYSSDQRYFSFEEFGIQDGSGSAYSNTYIIDLDQDRWVVGTPVSVIGDSVDSLRDVRTKGRTKIFPNLDGLGIFYPAQIAAFNGDGEPGVDGAHLTFGLPSYAASDAITGAFTLSLNTFSTPSGAPCEEWFDEKAIGFALEIEDFGVVRETHRDRTLPRSRGCPVDYKLAGVYLPYNATDISRSVALISVYVHGFEGPDRRYIAVPLVPLAYAL